MTANRTEDGDPAIRKVQRTGGSTFTVSLPKDWARGQGLTAGATVYLYAFEDRVVVAPTERAEGERRTRVRVDGLELGAVARRIRQAYAAGSDAVIVEASGGLSTEQRRAATDAITDLVGMRVAAESADGLEARSMLDPSAVSLAQTLAQLRQLVLTMLREAIEALRADDAALAATARGRAEDVDRLVALVCRQFQGALVDVREVDQLEGDRSRAYRHVRLARGLDRIADAAGRIAAVAAEQDTPPEGAVNEAVGAAGQAVRDAVVSALGEEPATVERGEHASEPLAELDAALAATADPDCHRYGRVLEALSLVAARSRTLATLGLDDG